VISAWADSRAGPAASYVTPYERACKVFCEGPILHAVQTAHLFDDGKAFVDMPLKRDPAAVLDAFSRRFADPARGGRPPDRDALAAFVAEHFEAPGSDMLAWVPPDHAPMPPRIANISAYDLRLFALGLHDLWLQLGREPARSVQEHPERHSLLYLPHPAIVPGGRFRETYAWDTLWIVRGLLVSGMLATARGLVQNLLHMVTLLHFAPNGGRIYYALPGRSQPPLLSRMVREIFEAEVAAGAASGAGDAEARRFLAKAYPALVTDLSLWVGAIERATSARGVEGRV